MISKEEFELQEITEFLGSFEGVTLDPNLMSLT